MSKTTSGEPLAVQIKAPTGLKGCAALKFDPFAELAKIRAERASAAAGATGKRDVPLPSDRLLKWESGARLIRLAMDELGIGPEDPACGSMIASAEMAEKCARELRESLEAMQEREE